MYLETKMAYTFDDCLLVPQHTSIRSRKDVDTTTRLTKNIQIKIPIISANMDTITESVMMMRMNDVGGVGILHRFMDLEKQRYEIEMLKCFCNDAMVCISLGVGEQNWDWLAQNKELINIICIDIAHGDCDKVIKLIEELKECHFTQDIIAGNVATPLAVKRLCNAGVDAVKVGIGPGSLCTTRIITGCGIPQLSAIIECAEMAKEFDVPIIADGGIRNSGDIIKALAAGASSVMIGGLLAGTPETPGTVIVDPKGNKYKKYRGMSSKDAMQDWKGNAYNQVTAEGETTFVPLKESAMDVVKNLVGGIRSGMTYNDARTISELQENAVFRVISSNARLENGAHGLKSS